MQETVLEWQIFNIYIYIFISLNVGLHNLGELYNGVENMVVIINCLKYRTGYTRIADVNGRIDWLAVYLFIGSQGVEYIW